MENKEKKRSELDDLLISVARLINICNCIIDECQRNDIDPVQLTVATAAVEHYACKLTN
jgi:hypothetical protein